MSSLDRRSGEVFLFGSLINVLLKGEVHVESSTYVFRISFGCNGFGSLWLRWNVDGNRPYPASGFLGPRGHQLLDQYGFRPQAKFHSLEIID